MTAVFEYDVEEPDTKSKITAQRGQGQVLATKGDEPAGFLIFRLGPGEDVIALTRIETFERFRRQGRAEGMIDQLQAHYPHGEIEDRGVLAPMMARSCSQSSVPKARSSLRNYR